MSEKVKSEVEKLERSDPKDAQIQFILGQHYFIGTEVHRDYAKALEWYEKAALQGFDEAQFKMGQCFLKGLGTEPDLQQAIEWFEKAGRNGHSQAALVLGQMYYKGEDLPKNLYEAKRWLELSGQPEAKALIYEINMELGTIKSTKMIDAEKTTLETLAQMKDPKGLYELGEWYYNGKYIPKDLEKGEQTAGGKGRLLCGKWESGNGGLKRLQEVPSLPPSLLSTMQAQFSAGKHRGSTASPLHCSCASVKTVVYFFQYLAVKPS